MENKEKSGTSVLVCGEVCGKFKLLFSKVQKLVAKNPNKFEYLFCTGEFFGENTAEWNALKSGIIKVPIPTYILGANNPDYAKNYDFLEGIPNIVYLGKKGYIRLTCGLKIAYLSGMEKSGKGTEALNSSIYFSEKDVNELIKSLESENVIDILLTSPWPAGVTKKGQPLEEEQEKVVSRNMSPLVSKLAKAVKPRYHFCGSGGVPYDRIPYKNYSDSKDVPTVITNFYGLPRVGETKGKFLRGFQIKPACTLDRKKLIECSGVTTDCPYGSSDGANEYFFDSVDYAGTTKTRKSANGGARPHKKQALDVGDCWFCVSNKKSDRNLIIKVGKLSYLALCKGGLVPEHFLIIPISHIASSTQLPFDVYEEMTQLKHTLVDYFEEQNMDVVIFERSYCSPHMCYQVVPVPKGKKEALLAELESLSGFYGVVFTKLSETSSLKKSVAPDDQYFYIEIYINGLKREMFCVDNKRRLPIQFGRILLANEHLLDVEDRINWKKCENLEVEKKTVEKFKKVF